jgi:phosphoglycolate phosphatase-like HAD superfamily hydrolase
MIGDGLTDVLAGKAAGCTTIFLGNRKCEICGMMEELGAWPDFIASSLLEAVTIINRRHVGQNTKKYKFYK